MEIKVIEREPVTVAFLRHTGPYGEGVGQFFRTVFYPWLAASQLLDRDCYGISHDDPRTTDPARCRYDTCVVVADDFIPQGGASMTVIPGGRYAVMHYQGRSADIGAAWAAIFNDWLPGSGYAVDARPCFEYYPREVPAHGELGEFYCDICVPVIEQRG